MSRATGLLDDYLRRSGVMKPPDATWQFEVETLRGILTRLEIVLEDEGVADATIEKVIRAMLYGIPSTAVAEQRMHREMELAQHLMRRSPVAGMGSSW